MFKLRRNPLLNVLLIVLILNWVRVTRPTITRPTLTRPTTIFSVFSFLKSDLYKIKPDLYVNQFEDYEYPIDFCLKLIVF